MSFGGGALLLSLSLGLAAAPTGSEKRKFHMVPLFTIGKSQNKNQVQYAIHVDGQCVPVPGNPVFAYWRMLEVGPASVEPLTPRELSAYGPASQVVTTRNPTGGKVRLVLRALPARPIFVETRRSSDGTCKALATVAIAGSTARLFDVYVKLTWHLSVEYLRLRGWSLDGSHIISEKLET